MKLLKNKKFKIILSAITKILLSLIGIITNKFVAVNLGGSGIIILGQLKAMTNLLFQVGIAGGNNLIIRLISRGYTNSKSHMYALLITVIIVSNLFFIIFFFFFIEEIAYYITSNYKYTNSFFYLLIAIPFIAINALSIAILNGYSSQIKYALAILLYPSLFLIFISIFGLISIDDLIRYFIISLVVGGLFSIFLVWKNIFPVKKRVKFTSKRLKYIGRYGLALLLPFVVNILLITYMRHEMMLIDIDYAGYWQGVYQISENLISIIYIFVITILLPQALKYKSPLETFNYLKNNYYLPIVLFLTGAMVFYTFSEFWLILFYSNEFLVAEDFIIYQLIGDFFKILGWIISLTLMSYGLLKLVVYIELINLIVGILSINFIIAEYGIIGGSYVYLLRYLIYFFILFIFFYLNYYRGVNGKERTAS